MAILPVLAGEREGSKSALGLWRVAKAGKTSGISVGAALSWGLGQANEQREEGQPPRLANPRPASGALWA